MAAVKLIGVSASPFVLRARVALNLKGVEYEYLQETSFPEKSELLLKSNPVHKKIPVLLHDDKPICESLIIVEYVDEVWAASGCPILPADAYDRALHRFWAAYLDNTMSLVHIAMMKAETEETKAEAIQQFYAGMKLLEGAFEALSKGKGFFGGDDIGYLDIAFGCFLPWIKVMSIKNGVEFFDEAKTPQLVKWAERFCTHEAVKEVVPETDKLLEVAKKREAQLKAAATN